MKFRKDLKIAVRLLEVLTMEPTPLSAYAGKVGTTIHFLEQIARKLRRDGLIRVQRGPGGGVFRGPDQPTIARVAVALGHARLLADTEVKETMDQVSNILFRKLDEIKVVGTLERGES